MTNHAPSEGHVCIFHQRIRALVVNRVRDTVTDRWFDYGLCPICANRLKKQHSFKADISVRLEELFEKMVKQEQEKQNKKGGIL